MECVRELSSIVGIARACDVLAMPRASFYRWQNPDLVEAEPRRSPPRALSSQERQVALSTLNAQEFCDKAPAEVYAALLDQGTYLCSISTMYRLLSDSGQIRERRDLLRHPTYKKPELLAEKPNQVWSWDITKLLGPAKWTYFNLYVILDIFSRYVVGWLLAEKESAALANRLIAETIAKEGVDPTQLSIHADRGPSMSSKPVAQLLADLGVTKSHSRPHVSDDNPFSESQFKTLKYRPGFPERFGSMEDARAFCRQFFTWYNEEHYHSGIALMTPSIVHHGQAAAVLQSRQKILDSAYEVHPERFVRQSPTVKEPPTAVWINPPASMPVDRPQFEPSMAPVASAVHFFEATGGFSRREVGESLEASPNHHTKKGGANLFTSSVPAVTTPGMEVVDGASNDKQETSVACFLETRRTFIELQ